MIRLENVTARNGAEALRNMEIYISEEDLEELPEGSAPSGDLMDVRCTIAPADGPWVKWTMCFRTRPRASIECWMRMERKLLIPAVEAFEREMANRSEA